MEPLLAALEKQNIRNPFSTGRPHRALRLTPREQALLQHLAAEHPATRIAEDLEVSPSTIRNHRKNLYRKLGATSRDHAIELARRAGLLKPATPPSSDRSD
jgi:DNA-binding CsgD family transcriptional regulator